ncbi:MAG: N-formylglutamate amidohydrolase [Minwuia sp.]|uniref:N-formylglutamate amidohydrolase n=1 Tax=Minwuia sp. TaxID=2493630 RepID=UPI003A8C15A2
MRIDPDRRLIDPALALFSPAEQLLPVVLASPHSGRIYPQAFLEASRLDEVTIRKSEDSFVDEIFEPAVARGAPLLAALFPRAYCDVNREPYELDPSMYEDRLPPHANTRSLRVAGGLGTIARVVSSGENIYRHRLPFAEAERRIRHYYRPYHAALSDLVDRTVDAFGTCLVIDCHSMPSNALPRDRRRRPEKPDIVLGDRFATSCARDFTDRAEAFLTARGYRVARNAPYAGGFCTSHYGRPGLGLHALQIEINRALYMDEARFTRRPRIANLALDMADLIEVLADANAAGMQHAAE